jgi:hypothetical protein
MKFIVSAYVSRLVSEILGLIMIEDKSKRRWSLFCKGNSECEYFRCYMRCILAISTTLEP